MAEPPRIAQRPLHQRRADAAAAMPGQNRDAELGMRVGARQVCGAGELQRVIEHAKHRVASEVDARDVVVDGGIRDGVAEAQPPVLVLERTQVGRELRAFQPGQLSGHDAHARLSLANVVPDVSARARRLPVPPRASARCLFRRAPTTRTRPRRPKARDRRPARASTGRSD